MQPEPGTALVPVPSAKTVAVELTPTEIVHLRQQQMQVIDELMKPGVHYGKIPNTPKPSLWQPGAQLLDTLHGYAATFYELKALEDFDRGLFNYTYLCRLIRRSDGITVGEAVGSCNSREKHYREAVYHGKQEGEPVNPCDNLNTFVKMAQKRAHVAATLNATGLADYFTQDIEDGAAPARPKGKTQHSALGQCPIHHKDIIDGKYGPYCPTKVADDDGKQVWCKGLATSQGSRAPAGASTDELPHPDSFKNIGDMLTAAKKHFGMTREDVLQLLGVSGPMDIASITGAWDAILADKRPMPIEGEVVDLDEAPSE